MADQTEAEEAALAEIDAEATSQNGTEPAATPAAAEPSKDRLYGIYTEVSLDLSSAAAAKIAVEQLKEYAVEGSLTVLARVGRAPAVNPKAAITVLAQNRDLDGDYHVIAQSSVNYYPAVKSQTKRDVSFG